MTHDLTRKFLREIFQKDGLTIKEFNHKSVFGEKSFEKLVRETRTGQLYISYVENMRRILSVRLRAGLRLRIPRLNIEFLEAGRRYPNGKIIEQLEPWTISGTRQKDEDMMETVKREAREEMGLVLKNEDFNFQQFWLTRQLPPCDKESRTYHRVVSRVWTQIYTCDLEDRPLDKDGHPWKDEMIFDDEGTSIIVRAFPL